MFSLHNFSCSVALLYAIAYTFSLSFSLFSVNDLNKIMLNCFLFVCVSLFVTLYNLHTIFLLFYMKPPFCDSLFFFTKHLLTDLWILLIAAFFLISNSIITIRWFLFLFICFYFYFFDYVDIISSHVFSFDVISIILFLYKLVIL